MCFVTIVCDIVHGSTGSRKTAGGGDLDEHFYPGQPVEHGVISLS
jgi:hypothetical protein